MRGAMLEVVTLQGRRRPGSPAASRALSLDEILVVTYRRASLDRFGRGSSLSNQDLELGELVEHQGWSRIGDYGDNNVSGSKTNVVRREFERMLRDIESGAVKCDLIVAYDLSRLFRNRRDKLRLEALMERGVHIYDHRYRIDTREKIGRIVFAFMAEWAIDRAIEQAEYQRSGARRRRREGRPSLNARPGWGFEVVRDENGRRVGLRVKEPDARALRWGAAVLLDGSASFTAVGKAWADPEHPYCFLPERGKPVPYRSVMRTLTRAGAAGCTEVIEGSGDDAVRTLVPNTDGTLPAILTIEQVLQLRELASLSALRYRHQHEGSGWREVKHLLAGIPECERCGARFRSSGSRPTRVQPRLICDRCKLSISEPFLNEFVTGTTIERIKSGALAKAMSGLADTEEVAPIAKSLAHEERQLQEFLALADEDDDVSPRAFMAYTSSKERRIRELRRQLAAQLEDEHLRHIPLLPRDIADTISEFWEETDIEWRRRLIRACWKQIIVRPQSLRGEPRPSSSPNE